MIAMKKRKILVLVLILVAIFSGCNDFTPDNDMMRDETSEMAHIDSGYNGKEISENETKEIQDECRKLTALYMDIYEHAEKIPSSDWSDKTVLSQEDIDSIESVLIKAGYPVINSDNVYPEYLENPDGILNLWENVKKEKDAETVFWEVSP